MEGDDEDLACVLSRQYNSAFNCGFISNFFKTKLSIRIAPGELQKKKILY